MSKATIYGLALGVLLTGSVLMMSCGEFLSLEPDCRISMIDPSPVAPEYDQQTGSLVFPSSTIYVENYSQVPVFFNEFRIEFFEATVEGGEVVSAEVVSIETVGSLSLYVPGVPTPDPYVTDSTATRQTRMTGSTGIQILTVAAYDYASSGTSGFEYDDDLELSARVTLWGESDTGDKITLWTSVPMTTLLQK